MARYGVCNNIKSTIEKCDDIQPVELMFLQYTNTYKIVSDLFSSDVFQDEYKNGYFAKRLMFLKNKQAKNC